ncbi:MAG TPA: aminoglycoside phosphotransferase family protein [Devosia sp.]|nr:aminoglycoside phosphotransferase family protein [Devosia sp.]
MPDEIPRNYLAAIVGAFPELRDAPLSVLNAGWDSIAIDADDRLIFKFPRNPDAASALRREAAFLDYLSPRLALPVPRLTLIETPFLFSMHAKLSGEHLVTEQYLRLPDTARDRMAGQLAQFYAELHALPRQDLETLGAFPIMSWFDAGTIRQRALPLLEPAERQRAEAALAAWERLPPDPFGKIYGYFDGHGWNMAFDHATQTLNGVYDFADSGFGDLSQDFIYSDLIAPDLTDRIIARYARLSGRDVDPARVHLLAGIHRLTELAGEAGNPDTEPMMLEAWRNWPGA